MSSGTLQSVQVGTNQITLVQLGTRGVAYAFDGCYAVAVGAADGPSALRVEAEILGAG